MRYSLTLKQIGIAEALRKDDPTMTIIIVYGELGL